MVIFLFVHLLFNGKVQVLQFRNERTVRGDEDPGAGRQEGLAHAPTDGGSLIHRSLLAQLVKDHQRIRAGIAQDVIHLHHLQKNIKRFRLAGRRVADEAREFIKKDQAQAVPVVINARRAVKQECSAQ